MDTQRDISRRIVHGLHWSRYEETVCEIVESATGFEDAREEFNIIDAFWAGEHPEDYAEYVIEQIKERGMVE